MGYSVENELRPKWDYLQEVCLYANFELSAFPAFFSYPLERVIKARFEYLGMVKKMPIHLMPLDEVVRLGDKDFAMTVAKDTDGFAFAEFLSKRGSRGNHMKRAKRNRNKRRSRSVTKRPPQAAAKAKTTRKKP